MNQQTPKPTQAQEQAEIPASGATIFDVEVQDDHLQRVSQVRKPILAVAELVWNAVDADADRVDVILHDGQLGGTSAIEVADNGHGIPLSDVNTLFRRLGGSWKQGGQRSREKRRLLHGKEGRGRFRAFSLGRVVDWRVCYESAPGDLRRYAISMVKDRPKRVQVGEESKAALGEHRGVVVTISELEREPKSLRSQSAVEELTQIFALYLRQYRGIKLVFLGTHIDPSSAISYTASYSLPDIESDGERYATSIEIVEWQMHAERRLFFCDAEGFPLDNTTPGVQAPGFEFTAYLKSAYFSKLLDENRLEIASLDGPTGKALDAAKAIMRDHFRKRSAAKAAGLVQEWQSAGVYPYQGEPTSEIETIERQMFNVVALNVNSYLPEFSTSDDKTKQFQLRLLRQAVERAPADLSKILTEVLDLPDGKRKELSELLDKTTLSAIISASKIVSDRIEFLRGLETLVFDDDFKNRVRERSQLHRIVAENVWMFGEQYHLSVDDQSLTEVLKKHIKLQGREVEIDEPVKREDGSRGVVDLMLSRNISLSGSSEREHLVVELKRPSVKIDASAADQIETYANAVADDERFKDVDTRWVFWAISNDVTDQIRRRSTQANRPRGMLYQDDKARITIWVKTWAQLIEECRGRLRFFEEKLGYIPNKNSSLAHLKATYEKYLSALFTDKALADEEKKVAELVTGE